VKLSNRQEPNHQALAVLIAILQNRLQMVLRHDLGGPRCLAGVKRALVQHFTSRKLARLDSIVNDKGNGQTQRLCYRLGTSPPA
jgi:hypothetical protein